MASAYEVTVDRPGAQKGEEVEIPGLGIFKNGEPKVVTAEQDEAFKQFNASSTTETDDDGNVSYVTKLGPSVEEAFEDHDWIHYGPQAEEKPAAKKAAAPKGGDS